MNFEQDEEAIAEELAKMTDADLMKFWYGASVGFASGFKAGKNSIPIELFGAP